MSNSEENQEVQEESLIKAGLRKGYFTLVEGVYDPGILKAVFLAGGPGSGKSATVNTLFDLAPPTKNLSPSGLKVVNSDPAFEILLKKAGYDLNLAKMDDETFQKVTSDDPNSIRSRAKKIMLKQFELFKEGRLGVIVDGTGDNYDKISKQKKALEKLGYDCYMVYVNTSLDVAQQRNASRERKLKRSLVKDIWTDVQKNLGAFQNTFGKNFVIIDNSEDTRSKTKPGRLDLVPHVLKATARFISKPIRNPIGKKWIKMMMAHDNMTKSGDKRNRVNEELDMVSMEGVVLPMDLERHLSRSIHVINKFKLNEKRNLAVLSRLVESLNLSRNQMVKYFHHIRTLKFKGETD
jgi:tRNA uridine 5-carbamoylmethylation protein Kti12